jgi:hypothetical protein
MCKTPPYKYLSLRFERFVTGYVEKESKSTTDYGTSLSTSLVCTDGLQCLHYNVTKYAMH